MTKITAEHLARTAYVYIRQSTADQLVHNKEKPAPPVCARRSRSAARLDRRRDRR